MGRQGDRRERERSEIVGQLWVSLGVVEPMPLRNVGRGGALLEAEQMLPLRSVHRMRLSLDEVEGDIEARVCHVRSAAFEGRQRYLIGLEFLELPTLLAERIERRLTGEAGGPGRDEDDG